MHTAMNLSSLVSARGFDCGLIQQVAVNEWRIPGQLQLFDFAQERLNTTSISHLKSCVTLHCAVYRGYTRRPPPIQWTHTSRRPMRRGSCRATQQGLCATPGH
ncbi:ORF002L [Rock bream iridovirus]|uniref:ORF002L n=1 Tax=Rock bream iridovirus TaxID=263891 RepID=Q5YF85_ISKNV|nr:ORF002L [Rock bream iridovirus]